MNTLLDPNNSVYFYFKEGFNKNYFVVGDGKWIVIIGEDGILETSFPPDHYKKYLDEENGYYLIGTVWEVMIDGL